MCHFGGPKEGKKKNDRDHRPVANEEHTQPLPSTKGHASGPHAPGYSTSPGHTNGTQPFPFSLAVWHVCLFLCLFVSWPSCVLSPQVLAALACVLPAAMQAQAQPKRPHTRPLTTILLPLCAHPYFPLWLLATGTLKDVLRCVPLLSSRSTATTPSGHSSALRCPFCRTRPTNHCCPVSPPPDLHLNHLSQPKCPASPSPLPLSPF